MMRKLVVIQCPKCRSYNSDNALFCNACGSKLSDPEVSTAFTETLLATGGSLPAGSIIAKRYSVIEELGKGGMGRVYRVLDKKLDVEVALKLLKPEIISDLQIIQRFKNELKLARMISHPNVCRMYDFSEDQGSYFITMEYVPGDDLKNTIKRLGSLAIPAVTSIAKQICDGLSAAHRLDIVHRDLKPHNIMLDRNGNVRIMDFGISRSMRAKGVTATGLLIGTPEYLSPEQAEGEKVDKRSDIYALGIILFEMLTGKVPFKGDTTLSVILKQRTEPPPDPRKLNPLIPKEFCRIVLKCLEKDRDRRYQDIDSLYADLAKTENALAGKREDRPSGEKRPSAAGRALWARRWPAVIGLASLLTIAGVSAFLLMPGRDRSGPAASAGTAPSPAIPAPAKASVAISGSPEGAEIYIDGQLRGTAPARLDLDAASYEIKISKPPEFKDSIESVSLQAGEIMERTYVLDPVYLLDISTEPSGAEIFINGVSQGVTPRSIEWGQSEGRLELRKGDAWIPLAESLKLSAGRTPIHRVLRRKETIVTHRLTVKTDPEGARVYAGDVFVGTSPIVARPMTAGDHLLRFEKQGYESRTFPLKLASDVEQTIALTKLPPALIEINPTPYADVYINERAVGESPPVKFYELDEGTHVLRFVNPSLDKSWTIELEIKSGDRKRVWINMNTGNHTVTDIKS